MIHSQSRQVAAGKGFDRLYCVTDIANLNAEPEAEITFLSGENKTMALFENLSDRLSHSLKAISGKSTLSEENIKDTLREVRMALLEADVALPV